jgi:hypothetical protein
LLISHSSFASHALLAQGFPFLIIKTETFIAHPLAAPGTSVKLHERFQIGGFKRYEVFFPPQQRPGFLMLYGQPACLKGYGGAFPFLSADVAEKAERKAVFVRMVNYFTGQRFAHIYRF